MGFGARIVTDLAQLCPAVLVLGRGVIGAALLAVGVVVRTVTVALQLWPVLLNAGVIVPHVLIIGHVAFDR